MLCWTSHGKGLKTDRHSAVTVGHKVYSFGGPCCDDTEHVCVHVLNTVSLRWTKLLPPRPPVTTTRSSERSRHPDVPSARRQHTAVLIGDTVYIWGGYPYCNVLYAFDVDGHRWSKPEVSGTLPEARYNHAACVSGTVMYVFGGNTMLTGQVDHVCRLDINTMVWSLIDIRGVPVPVTATIIGTKVFVFGGQTNCDTLRVFDTETNGWLHTPQARRRPLRRWWNSAFAYDGELYIFGGRYWDQRFNDLWKFNPETFAWKRVKSKGTRPHLLYSSRMCCCMVGDHVVLFGGFNNANNKYTDNLYVLHPSPSLKMLCEMVVIQFGLEQSELPHDIRWELAAMTINNKRKKNIARKDNNNKRRR